MPQPRLHVDAAARVRAHRARKRLAKLASHVLWRQIGPCTLYCGEARGIAQVLQHIDAVITDPPYGVNFDFTKARRSRKPLQPVHHGARWATNILGDAQPFDPTPCNPRHGFLYIYAE